MLLFSLWNIELFAIVLALNNYFGRRKKYRKIMFLVHCRNYMRTQHITTESEVTNTLDPTEATALTVSLSTLW
jgi:hypothetical protein